MRTPHGRLYDLLLELPCPSKLCSRKRENFCRISGCQITKIADAILADGWMRPPVKVGQTLYTTYCYGIGDWRIEESVVYEVRQRIGTGLEVFEMRRNKNGTFSYFLVELDKLDKTVFTTNEKALEALKVLKGGAE